MASDGVALRMPTHAVEVAFRVLEGVSRYRPIGTSELARELRLPKATVHRSLHALQALGYVYSDGPSRRWQMTTRAFHVGSRAVDTSLIDLATPEMQRLVEHTTEATHLTVPEGRYIVVMAKLDGSQSVRSHTALGEYIAIHASASGKAILAASEPEVIDQLLSEPLERFTESTIIEPAEVRAGLEAIRTRGYAVNYGERRADVFAVGAAILDGNGQPVAGFGVSVPKHRFTPEVSDSLAEQVVAAAATIGRRLGA